MISSQYDLRRSACLALAGLAFAAAFAAAAPAVARSTFDGMWSVVVVTTTGDCDRAYRYPISITGGTLANGGTAAFDISGKVGGDGAITVRVSNGSKSANGSGRLTETGGSGSWSGGACAGVWQAERRS